MLAFSAGILAMVMAGAGHDKQKPGTKPGFSSDRQCRKPQGFGSGCGESASVLR